jgi:hypothetical protein
MVTHTSIWFAIYDRKSGGYLPKTKTRAGATWLEFSITEPPRLFKKKQHAGTALRHWKEGMKTRIYQVNLSAENLGDHVDKITPRDLTLTDPCIVRVLIRQC